MIKQINVDEYAGSNAEKYKVFKKNSFNENIQIFNTLKILGDLNGKSIIDYACGTGLFAQLFADKGASRIVGIDSSESMIDLCRKTYKQQNIEFHVGDCSKILDFGFFDINYSAYLLQYSKNEQILADMIASIYASIKPGGIAVGIIPNLYLSQEQFDKLEKYGQKPKHNDDNGQSATWGFVDPDGNFLFEVVNYRYARDVYQNLFLDAGFKKFEWIPLTVNYDSNQNGFFDFAIESAMALFYKAQK